MDLVKTIARDHDIIFCLMDEMSHYAVTAKEPNVTSMKARCAEMILEYCSEHFNFEEHEMRRADYPALEAHMKEHCRVQLALSGIKYGLGCSDLLDLVDFLRNVLIRHIITWDEDFLKWEGVQEDREADDPNGEAMAVS